MKNQLLNKRIPVIFGIGIILLTVILTTIIVRIQTSFKSNASNSEEPQNVKITNLSNNSFTITYQTVIASDGSVNYGTRKELGNTQLEDFDKKKGNLSPKNIHSITVKKLDPSTKYYVTVISGQNTFLNKGVPFEISTGPIISSASAAKFQVKGKVILPDGNPPNETLVYLKAKNSQLLSSIDGQNGEFNFSLDSLRSDDLNSYLKLNDSTFLELTTISDSLKSTVFVSLSKANPIPTITLSNDYDFTNDFAPIASKSAESKFVNFFSASKPEGLKPQILIPKKDQSFTDRKPQFRGTSLPNEEIEIIIHSDEQITSQVTADNNGNWTYSPPNNLSPGVHTITIKTRDSEGILTTITRSFTVFAQESAPSPTFTPTPTAILILTPTPFPSISPVSIESKGGLPPTGTPPFLFIIGGIAAVASGLILFLLSRSVSL